MPKRFHPVPWRTRKTQKHFADTYHDRIQAEKYDDADFLIAMREKMSARLREIGVPMNGHPKQSKHAP